MTKHFVKLSCESCGIDLDLYDDVQRFACALCGAVMEVRRRGGTAAVLGLADSVEESEISPKSTDVALALRRLGEDAENLAKQRERMMNIRSDRKRWGYVAGVGLILFGLFIVRFGIGSLVGLSVLMAGILTIIYIRRSDKRMVTDGRELQAKIDVLNGRIEEHTYHAKMS
jgi:hypothetical protein